MTLQLQVLGGPGDDNALFVKVDSGQHQTRLLFDCGEGCCRVLPFAEVLAIDHLFFSHLHMDHVGGFDAFFRATFDRTTRPNRIWGPADTAAIMQHRFQGYLWNLVDEKQPGTWHVHDILPGEVRTTRFEAFECFRTAHAEGTRPWDHEILDGAGFTVEALLLDHGTPSIGYVVREPARINVDTAKMAERGLPSGPWARRLRGPAAGPGEVVEVGGVKYPLAELQRDLLVTTRGESVAYLTDFRMNRATTEFLAGRLAGVETVVCECQYAPADRELAERTMHSTADEVAGMAAAAGVGRLILFHLSSRYEPETWRAMLDAARAVFPRTAFPDGWAV